MMFGLDPLYFVFLAPGDLLALWAQWRIHQAYAEARQIPAQSGLSGADAAEAVLADSRVPGVRIEYTDGTRATMLLLNGLVDDFTFAARIKGAAEPLSTLFYLPPNPNVTYSACLMEQAERLFVTGKAPYPIERTLLTSGLVEAGLHSLAGGQRRLETPHLAVKYQASQESLIELREQRASGLRGK